MSLESTVAHVNGGITPQDGNVYLFADGRVVVSNGYGEPPVMGRVAPTGRSIFTVRSEWHGMGTGRCENRFSFEPQTNGRYRIGQVITVSGMQPYCSVAAIDEATGLEPTGFAIER